MGWACLATQFLITLVAPQFAVGTYSYAIGLNTAVTPDGALISDDIRSVPTGIATDNAGPTGTATVSGTSGTAILLGTYMNQNAGALTDVTQVAGVNMTTPISSTASVAIPNGGASTPSTITVNDPYQQVRQDYYDPIEVRVDIATTYDREPDSDAHLPVRDRRQPGHAKFCADGRRCDRHLRGLQPDQLESGSQADHPPRRPAEPNRERQLDVDHHEQQRRPVTLNDWSLILPLTTNVFAVPNPVLGTPFQAPYNTTTQPLIIPGPHVVSTAVVSAGTYNTTTTYTTTNVVVQGDQQNLSKQNNINISGNLDNIALSLAAGASTTTDQLLLPITDAFQIQQDATDQIQVNLNLAGAVGDDLEIQLVAQDGNSVTLINGTDQHSNTLVFNDYAPTGTSPRSRRSPPWWATTRPATGSWSSPTRACSTATLTVA